MLELASQIPLCMTLAAILGLMIGYFLACDICNEKKEQNIQH